MSLRYLLALFIIFLSGGCTDFYTPVEDQANELLPETYSTTTSPFDATVPWWQGFNSPELTDLITDGLDHNFTIQKAWARLAQAQALTRKAGAAVYPQIDGAAGAAHNRSGLNNGQEISNDDFSLGISAGYEVDLWGRIKASQEEAIQTMYSRQEDVYSAAMSLSGQIATSWLELISTRRKIIQLNEQQQLNTKLLELIELRFRSAKATALDLYQQQQTLAAIEGRLITLQGDQKTLLHQLAVLTGTHPLTPLAVEQIEFPGVEPLPPGGLPADLLIQRPDIRSAEFTLESAAWSVAEAKADRLPKLRLTGDFAYNAGVLESLLDTWILRLAAGLTGPVFDGGERSAEVERREAILKERLAEYYQRVLDGVLEVEDALAREKQFQLSVINNLEQIELTKRAYREATWRYLNGQSDYLPVLREQINLITTQQDQITLEKDLLLARVNLSKALGGSWMIESFQEKE